MTPRKMMTTNVKSIPTNGMDGGSSTPGRTNYMNPGSRSLSSQLMIEAMAQIVTPIGAKKRIPATK